MKYFCWEMIDSGHFCSLEQYLKIESFLDLMKTSVLSRKGITQPCESRQMQDEISDCVLARQAARADLKRFELALLCNGSPETVRFVPGIGLH